MHLVGNKLVCVKELHGKCYNNIKKKALFILILTQYSSYFPRN